ncbi:MAG: hypothetical protein QOI95_324 [Acidimicrobiaceae bacterium]|jgi:hypothetical protein
MSRIGRALICTVVMVLALGATAATPSLATTGQAEAPKLTISPADGSGSFFTVTGAPGETKPLTASLRNPGTQSVPARTYAADAFTVVNGGLGARTWGDAKSAPTTWLDYPDENLNLGAGEAVQRNFNVAIPADASAGQHIAALVIENQDLFSTGSDAPAQQRLRQVIAVLVTVSGPLAPAFSIRGGHHSVVGKLSIVAIGLTNSGNVLVQPAGPMVIRDERGQEVVTTTVRMGSLYAGNSADLEVPLASILQPGNYTASLSLTDAATGASAAADVPFVVAVDTSPAVPNASGPGLPEVHQTGAVGSKSSDIPYLLIAGLVLTTAGAVGAAMSLRTRRRRTSPART